LPKTNSTNKPVRSFRLSHEGVRQLRTLATTMERSESDVIEVALDRMYREEIRFNRMVREGDQADNQYHIDPEKEEKNERYRNAG
jgi:predicted transcriptional regulator